MSSNVTGDSREQLVISLKRFHDAYLAERARANAAEAGAAFDRYASEQIPALVAHIEILEDELGQLKWAALENAETNAITYRLAYLLGLRDDWASA